MNWIPIGLNWTILFKCLEMTIVVIWRYINKTELNWIEAVIILSQKISVLSARTADADEVGNVYTSFFWAQPMQNNWLIHKAVRGFFSLERCIWVHPYLNSINACSIPHMPRLWDLKIQLFVIKIMWWMICLFISVPLFYSKPTNTLIIDLTFKE